MKKPKLYFYASEDTAIIKEYEQATGPGQCPLKRAIFGDNLVSIGVRTGGRKPPMMTVATVKEIFDDRFVKLRANSKLTSILREDMETFSRLDDWMERNGSQNQ